MINSANSNDLDKIQQEVEFHQSLHCLFRQKQFSEIDKHFFKIITCDSSIYIRDHPGFIVCSFTENVIGLKRLRFVLR